MQPLTDAIPLPASFATQRGAQPPPVPGFFRHESPPSSEVGLLDLPDAFKRQTRRDHALIGGHDSVQRILVCVERDRPLRLVRLRSLPPDDEDDLAWDHREGPKAPSGSLKDRRCPTGKGREDLHPSRPPTRDARPPRLAINPIELFLRLSLKHAIGNTRARWTSMRTVGKRRTSGLPREMPESENPRNTVGSIWGQSSGLATSTLPRCLVAGPGIIECTSTEVTEPNRLNLIKWYLNLPPTDGLCGAPPAR